MSCFVGLGLGFGFRFGFEEEECADDNTNTNPSFLLPSLAFTDAAVGGERERMNQC